MKHDFDSVDLHWLYVQTVGQLNIYERRVREGKSLEAALDFAQFVIWSGLPKLMEAHSQPDPLKVDGAFLRYRANELQEIVRSNFKGEPVPVVNLTELEKINHKLDLIAGRVAMIAPAPEVGELPEIAVLPRVAT